MAIQLSTAVRDARLDAIEAPIAASALAGAAVTRPPRTAAGRRRQEDW